MKKVIVAFSFLCAGTFAVNAQDSTSTSTQTQQYPTSTSQDDQDRERINSRDLPDAVKRSLEATEYRGWLVNAAYKTSGVNDQAMSTESNTMSSDSSSVSGGPRMETDSTSMSDNSNTNTETNTNSSTNSNTDTNTNANTSGAYGQEVFVVELKNGAQTKTVRFDKEGNKLDDQGSDNDQK